jgi:hypothetical protein
MPVSDRSLAHNSWGSENQRKAPAAALESP